VVFARDRKVSNLISSFIDHGHENDSSVPRNLDGAAIAGINCRMTELQAAILKVQLSKLDMIVDSYAERFDVLRKHFSNLSVRSEFIESQPLRDNLMVTGLNQSQIKKLTLQLQANGVATKNVPDALRWHSAYHFDHVFPSLSNDPKVRRTHSALLTSLAVNVDPRVSVSDLAKTLAKLDMVC
jgi:dTDP-4-amino-4,6-dideoxygalactose transaminase